MIGRVAIPAGRQLTKGNDMRYLVRKSYIDVIGGIWWPIGALCSLRIDLSDYDIENMRDDDGEITRESVEDWLGTHSGDFSSVDDFRASIEDGENTLEFEWAEGEDSECKYIDTLPCED
jgi:hypothetical protein